MLNQLTRSDEVSGDVIELAEISYALARAETALLTGDATKVIEELERLQTRAAALVSSLQRRACAKSQAA